MIDHAKYRFELVDIDNIEFSEALTNMVDIEVENMHTFTLSNGIVSHNSAISNLINVRDPKIHGGFPLRGKVLNVHGMSPVDVFKNQEIENICSIVGVEIGKEARLSEMNYGTIGILADADVDGSHIKSLLINFFHTYWPELLQNKQVVAVHSPIVVATNQITKEKKYFYTKTEWKEFQDTPGWDHVYKKGLGTLTEDEYSEIINNPRFDVIIPGDMAAEELYKAFGDDANLRKEWLQGDL